MNKGTWIAIRNCVLGPILYFIVLWILARLFDDVRPLAVAFSVMGVMIVDAAHESFRAGEKAGSRPHTIGASP
ncbi:MAG TPA: hypothetical protein PLB67_01335 [Candidatus Hydrogenedentes bacterium]|jgi:hypothetical protein|nr:hypothetical protein [Candidatus Hydrogenedentota bacterium]MDY0033624.1 hypothetical protein [FCB group bacterium]NLT61859.1 hypothetical protein [Candidatus Hydrogenedentota bacterium]HNZ18605.1 hypothetical protein [Candidatus Hydrogenedentota bacterium]HOH33946.1 hypothetical protein [Candidatus Hydrogenedentota bacterium]